MEENRMMRTALLVFGIALACLVALAPSVFADCTLYTIESAAAVLMPGDAGTSVGAVPGCACVDATCNSNDLLVSCAVGKTADISKACVSYSGVTECVVPTIAVQRASDHACHACG